MKNILPIIFSISCFYVSSDSIAASGCLGNVTKLWVEADDKLYFDITPTGSCTCNYVEGGGKGFIVSASQLNKDEQYTALLAAFMADKEVMSWYDWDSPDGTKRCKSYNISLSK